jgi:RNase H-fold protein (predicted Holliday junction resolvase)
MEWLYSVEISTVKVGYPKNIAQRNGNFDNNHIWTYGYLLRRIFEVAEEYGINVIYVDETHTSSRCPLHGDGCGARISRGLFRCTRLGKVFNADLAAAYNMLVTAMTPSPERGRDDGPETRPRAEPPRKGNVAQTSLLRVGRGSVVYLKAQEGGDLVNASPTKVELILPDDAVRGPASPTLDHALPKLPLLRRLLLRHLLFQTPPVHGIILRLSRITPRLSLRRTRFS